MALKPPSPSPSSPTNERVAAIQSTFPGAWRRNLALVWLGQVVSHVGDALFISVMFFVALEVTGTPTQAGLFVALNFLPALALGLFAGAIVDRINRRKAMLYADLLRAVSVAAIPLLHAVGHLTPLTLALAMFALASGSTLFNPALKAFVPEVTPASRLTSTASAFQVAEYAALVVGPLLAAELIPRLGTISILTVDAATFLFSAACIALLPTAAARTDRWKLSFSTARDVAREALTGVAQVWAVPALKALLVVATLNNLAIMGLAHVGTPMLVDSLGLGADAYAQTLVYFFIGMAAGSAALGLWGRHLPKGPTLAVGILLDGITFLPFAFCDTLGELKAAQLAHALFIPLIIIPRTVLIQQLVPGPLHGRAFALVNVTVFGMMALSSGVTGWLATVIPVKLAFAGLGLVGAGLGVIGLMLPSLRSAR